MGLYSKQRQEIRDLLIKKITNKLKTYARESISMPFLTRLMQDSEKVAAYSFIHSLATSLGMSIYEDVSKIIAKECKKKLEDVENDMLRGIILTPQEAIDYGLVTEIKDGLIPRGINFINVSL